MNAQRLRARIQALADRVSDEMNMSGVNHRMSLMEPALRQLEEVMYGIETKMDAHDKHLQSLEEDEAPTPRDPKLPKLKRKQGNKVPEGEVKIATARAGMSTSSK